MGKIKLSKLFSAAALLAILGLSTACQPPKDDSVAATPLPFGPCANCGGFTQATLYNSVAEGTPLEGSFPMRMEVRMVGDVLALQTLQAAGHSPKNYSGPIFVDGLLTFLKPVTAGYCVIPAGAYRFQTLTAGQSQNGVFSIPQIQAFGPTQLVFEIVKGLPLDPNADGVPDRVSFHLRLLQGPPTALAPIAACNDIQGMILL